MKFRETNHVVCHPPPALIDKLLVCGRYLGEAVTYLEGLYSTRIITMVKFTMQ